MGTYTILLKNLKLWICYYCAFEGRNAHARHHIGHSILRQIGKKNFEIRDEPEQMRSVPDFRRKNTKNPHDLQTWLSGRVETRIRKTSITVVQLAVSPYQIRVGETQRAVWAQPNSTVHQNLVPALAAVSQCTQYECEIRSRCAQNYWSPGNPEVLA